MHDSHEIGSNQTSDRDKLLKNFFMEKVLDSFDARGSPS